MTVPLADFELEKLCQEAEAAGLRWRQYAGGALVLEPWPQVRQYPELVEQLREHKTALARYLGQVNRPDLLARDWVQEQADRQKHEESVYA